MSLRHFRDLQKIQLRLPVHGGWFLLVSYALILAASFFISYLLRFDFDIPVIHLKSFIEALPWMVAIELIALYFMGQFSILLGYFRIPDLYRIALAITLSTAVLIADWYFNTRLSWNLPVIPRGAILANYIVVLFALCSFRMLLRIMNERRVGYVRHHSNDARVAIAGAGDAGAQLAADMLSKGYMKMRPVVFLDDDKKKWHHFIHGIPVVGSPDILAVIKERYEVSTIIIAMPSAPAKRIRDIVDNANELHVNVQTVPSLDELAMGKVSTTKIRSVQIEDLLGRKPVVLETDNIRKMLVDKVILVTGAGGSIGSELVHQIATYGPQRIIMVDQSEFAMFTLESQLKDLELYDKVVPVVASIRDLDRMRDVISQYKPDAIFHAAAYKHVPIMERQPDMALVNNSLGTAHLAELASELGVKRFVLISTDKAINPTSAMGASKRLAEIYIQALNYKPGNTTRFMAVRFGNVLNSSGSVVPIFRKQIEAGGPVTVTHPEVTRFFMTIPEAVGLVLQCGTLGKGGEIFVLNMGTPVKIVDMARQMIRMSGFRPDVDIDIKFVGLRPGEKLYEELQHEDEHYTQTRHERIYRFTCEPSSYDQVKKEFEQMANRLPTLTDSNAVRSMIKQYVPEYTPFVDI
jgi:FlaA1/EpsC-like NDP-sugar epimerase